VKKLLNFFKLISIGESCSNFNISPNLGLKIKKLPHRYLTDQRLFNGTKIPPPISLNYLVDLKKNKHSITYIVSLNTTKPPQCITRPHGGLSNNILGGERGHNGLRNFNMTNKNKQTTFLKR
jgi:hypothetical protein